MSNAAQKSPFVERLPCKLSDDELALKSRELAHAVNKRDSLTLEKSLAAQRFAKDLKECERRIGDLAEEVRNGVEYRHIKVIERKNFERNVVEIIRTDTHEPCGQRAMRGDERQADMFPKAEPQLALGDELGPDDEADDDEDCDDFHDATAEISEH
jgi:hypothetical protein